MYALKLARRALDDLDEIAGYLVRETASPALARDFVDLLLSRCRTLSETPFQLGRARDDLGPGLRRLVEGNYVILFR